MAFRRGDVLAFICIKETVSWQVFGQVIDLWPHLFELGFHWLSLERPVGCDEKGPSFLQRGQCRIIWIYVEEANDWLNQKLKRCLGRSVRLRFLRRTNLSSTYLPRGGGSELTVGGGNQKIQKKLVMWGTVHWYLLTLPHKRRMGIMGELTCPPVVGGRVQIYLEDVE